MAYMTIEKLAQRIKRARQRVKLVQQDLADCAGVTRAAVSQWENTTENVELKADHLLKISRLLKVRPRWLQYGEEPMEEIVTDNLQKKIAISLQSLEDGIMSEKNNNGVRQVKKMLGDFEQMLRTYRTAPVVGSIRIQDGHTMLVEGNLGAIGVYSADPNVHCYEDDTGDFSPWLKPHEIIIVEPGVEPAPTDDVLVIKSDGTILIKEFISSVGNYYNFDDTNERERRIRVSKEEVKDMWYIAGIYKKAKRLPRPLVPEGPKNSDDKEEHLEDGSNGDAC